MQSPPEGVVKVAIQANNKAVLFKLDQNQPLENIVQDVCKECGVNYVKDKYALQLLPQVNDSEVFVYITEFNRYLVKNGRELKLVYGPVELAKMIRVKLNGKATVENLSWALNKGAICSADPAFCKEFHPTGYAALQSLLRSSILTKELYNKSLQIILNLIRTNYLKGLDQHFLLQLKQIITSEQHVDEATIETALELLEGIILASDDSESIMKLINPDEFIHHLWSRDLPTVQSNTLSLINAMVLKSSKARTQRHLLQKMNSKSFKDNIYTNIIANDAKVSANLAHALNVFQSLILTIEKERYRNVIKSESLLPELEPYLKSNEIERKVSSDIHAEFVNTKTGRKSYTSSQTLADDLSLNASVSSMNLLQSDEEIDDSVFVAETNRKGAKKDDYISQLTFDCIFYFYNNYRDEYKLALLDEGESYTRFLHTCERVVQILCVKVLRIGNIPESGDISYCPLVFFTNVPFLEELFSKAVCVLLKTKREMKARSASDLDKVYQVLEHQLREALSSQPASYERLVAALSSLSYSTVRSQWEEEQSERERNTLANSPAIKQLKQSLVSETRLIIKQERLQYIKAGTEFPVWNAQRNQRVKNKTWSAFLTANEKTIQYEREGEVHQLSIQHITSLLTGRRCAHVKPSKSRATNGELAFSLTTDEMSLDFIAPTQEVYDHWTDAINILLGNEMKSVSMKRDLNCLLEMELRLRLLETDGIELPCQPPPVPIAPPNYDFHMPQSPIDTPSHF